MDSLIDSVLDGLFDVIYSVMELVLDSFVGRLLYYAETGLCKIVGMLDQMFQVFAGITKVSYDGNKDYLVNIFFNNRSINNVYWGMALIGIAMAFGFAIAAVVRKMFDMSGRQQQSLGQIITSFVRTIFLILGMSAIMVIVLNSTNVLMQQINYIFNDPENLDLEETITYTDEDFAAMGRVLNTIGNYSLNPSYSSRYNINACFNEIRQDLNYLQQQKVFRYYYTTADSDGNPVNTWQSVLQKIANSHDLRTDLKLDVSYDAVTKSLLETMDIIRNDPSFKPLQSYSRVMPAEGLLPLDRYLFLMGTMHAAKNSDYNTRAELTDPVRGPYYSGEKSIYSISQVSSDFDIGFATDYLVVFISGIALIFDLVIIILNCIARIFNMLFLYLIAPPIFATQPLDNGGKTRQWLTSFVVQAFSVFGTVIAMRLLLILLPIVTSSRLVLFENSMLNAMAKLVLIYGLFEVSKKATGLLTGILADSAGWQSVQAGDMSGSANSLIGGVTGAAKALAGTAFGATTKVADFATRPAQNLARRGWNATGGKVMNAWNTMGMGLEDKATAQAKERLAVDQAYAKLTGGGASGGGSASGGGGDSLPGTSGGRPSGGGGNSGPGGSLPNSGGGPGGGGGSAKTPPSLPGKASAGSTLANTAKGGGNASGGQKKPLSPQAQKVFGTDASGKTAQGGGAGGGKNPLSPQAQKLFGTDASGKATSGGGEDRDRKPVLPRGGASWTQGHAATVDATGDRPVMGPRASAKDTAKEAPQLSNRPTLDGGGGDQRPFDRAPGGEPPVMGGGGGDGELPQNQSTGAFAGDSGYDAEPSSMSWGGVANDMSGGDDGGLPQNQSTGAFAGDSGYDAEPPSMSWGGEASDMSGGDGGGLPQNQSTSAFDAAGYGGEMTGSGSVELGDAGSRSTIEPAPTPPPPSYAREAPAPSSRPTLDSLDSRQSAAAQTTRQTAAPGGGGQKPLSEAAQNLFGVDAGGKAKTPPPITRQSAPTQSTRQSAPAQPTRQSAPAQPTRQSAPTQPTRQSAPTQPTRQSAPTQPTRQSAPAQSARQSAPSQTTRQSAPAQSTWQSAPAQPARQSAPAQTTRQSAPSQPTRQSAPAQPTRQSAPAQPTQSSAPASAPPPKAPPQRPPQGGGLPNNRNGKK